MRNQYTNWWEGEDEKQETHQERNLELVDQQGGEPRQSL